MVRNGESSVREESIYAGPVAVKNELFVVIDDEDYLAKLAKALRHWLSVCGQQFRCLLLGHRDSHYDRSRIRALLTTSRRGFRVRIL